MQWYTGIMVYVILWWLIFFMMLPIGARSYHEAGEPTEVGNVESAPMRPRLWLKAGATTVISAIVGAALYFLINSGAISFRP